MHYSVGIILSCLIEKVIFIGLIIVSFIIHAVFIFKYKRYTLIYTWQVMFHKVPETHGHV